MSAEIIYFIKINIAFIIFYAFYRALFYKDTFFKLRRFILLGFFTFALIYPTFTIQEWIVNRKGLAEIAQIYSTLLPETIIQTENTPVISTKEMFRMIGVMTYCIGVLILLFRFFIQLSSILWLKTQSRISYIHTIKIYQLQKPAAPFSFFRWIFLYPENYSREKLDEILTHELTHAGQWHSIDVIICNLICIICWFNPFAWLLKREVNQNLEYLADNKVLEVGYDSRNYQYHLVELTYQQPVCTLYNNFSVLPLKNRIRMMNKERSHELNRSKYLLLIPLLAVLILMSNVESAARISYLAPIKETVKGTLSTVSSPSGIEAIFTVVDEMPVFTGGEEALLNYINQNTKYPQIASQNRIQGRVVISFIVNKDGSVCEAEVIHSVDPSLDAEALRVVNEMPDWKPGKQWGNPVAVKYNLPIIFRLS